MVCNVSNILLAHGYADPTCDVYRFWDSSPLPLKLTAVANVHTTNISMVLPLMIRCPPADPGGGAQVLIFFGSFGPGATVEFELNATALGMGGNLTAIDVEDGGQQLLRVQGGGFRFRLDRHSFRMVAVKTDDSGSGPGLHG